MRTAGGKYRVVKNTLAERAAAGHAARGSAQGPEGRDLDRLHQRRSGRAGQGARKYAKDNPEFSFKAGVVEGSVDLDKEISALATMPSKEEMYSKLLFLISAPAQRLVTVMNAVGRDVAVVIDQGVEKKKFKGRRLRASAAPAAAEAAAPKRSRRKGVGNRRDRIQSDSRSFESSAFRSGSHKSVSSGDAELHVWC